MAMTWTGVIIGSRSVGDRTTYNDTFAPSSTRMKARDHPGRSGQPRQESTIQVTPTSSRSSRPSDAGDLRRALRAIHALPGSAETMPLPDASVDAVHAGLADEISARFRRLCEQSGFAENFDAPTGEGLRDRAYTWTASAYLILAAAHEQRGQWL
ncbi:hypothetical protein ACIBO2_38960 [Nonomuraea sp. NPDC050022]|uniref:hypothetical protein n=1 Tax=unclassified Nonomuraea TaxID=2593643 RepID=UPI0033D934AE